jgi:hypothetical protein
MTQEEDDEKAAAEAKALADAEAAKNNVKQFTQADIDRIVKREKAPIKALQDEVATLRAGKDDTLKAYEDTTMKIVTELSKEVPEPIKKLLAKLSPLEQLEYLNDPANNILFEKKEFPLTKKKATGTPEFKPSKIDPVF